MLALATIFLATFLIASIAVSLYRKISGWHGFNETLVGRPGATMLIQIKAQQGYISLVPASREHANRIRLRSPKGGIKAPWGW
jgi:hypothetical protein